MAGPLTSYLVDTNVWLERMLDQERSDDVGRFLSSTPSDRLYITDFALHSIGLILTRLQQSDDFNRFVQDVLINGSVGLVRLTPSELAQMTSVINRYSLDFDDAYQYVAAKRYSLELVSFDADFDRTDLIRLTPSQAA